MARKTKEEAEATRTDILNAAEACFLEEGVFRTTLEQIAARAGYTRGAVYWHFSNKLEVFEAVLERVEVPILDQLEQVASPENDRPLQALRQFYQDAFDRFTTNPHARSVVEITLLRCELVEETRPILMRHQESMASAVARLNETFLQAHRLGQLRQGMNPETCALTVHFAVVGALRQWALDAENLSLQREGMASVDALLTGFAADNALTDAPKKSPAPRTASRRAD